MKTITIIYLVFFLLFTSCKKDSSGLKSTDGKFCWHCTFGASPNGSVMAPKDTCWEHDYPPVWRDANNNDVGEECTKQ